MKNIDPSIKKFFPWALFLVLAAVFALLALNSAHGAVPTSADIWACYGSGRYQAMSSAYPACNDLRFCADWRRDAVAMFARKLKGCK